MKSASRLEPNELANADGGQLSGRCVLIVEDDPFISLDLDELLKSVGVQVIGPVPTVDAALRLLGTSKPHAAVLDLNLRGERSTPIAVALQAEEIPFVLVSGYSRSQIDEPIFDDAPLVPKPVQPDMLLAVLGELMQNRRSAS